jgi:transcriptional regulator with XRE-family HTH domain
MVRGDSSFRDEVRPIDWHVGGRLRARRLALGMSQVRLAEALGLTFQQVQKYEHGTNRVVASRLFDLAGVLQVPVDYFFAEAPPEALYDVADRPDDRDHRPTHREILDLVRVYYEIEDDGLRHKLIDLVKSVARSKS